MKFFRYIIVLLCFFQGGVYAKPINPGSENTSIAETFEHALVDVKNQASEAVLAAVGFLGVNYRYGGVNYRDGFDCSGFTKYIFDIALGIKLPHNAQEQANLNALQVVDRSNLQPGDLVFFNTMRHAFSHVGIYIGGNKFIHAPRRGARVRIDDMSQAYWLSRFNGARRIDQDVPL